MTTKPPRYVMKHDRLRDLGAFTLGVMEHAALTDSSQDVRRSAQTQLDLWVAHGYIDVDSEPGTDPKPTEIEDPR